MIQEPLFVEIGPKIDPVTEKPATLAQRQQARIEAGLHPLAGVGADPRMIRLAPAGTGTCGTCQHRSIVNTPVDDGYRGKDYPKCIVGAKYNDRGQIVHAPRVSNSDATDCRAKWPACVLYEPVKETADG